jgi:hypothetical protein
MKYKTYSSDGLEISFNHNDYVGDKLDYVVHIPKTDARWELEFY